MHLSATLSAGTCSEQTSNKASFINTLPFTGYFLYFWDLKPERCLWCGENPSRSAVKPAAHDPNFTLLSPTFWNYCPKLFQVVYIHLPECWQACGHLCFYILPYYTVSGNELEKVKSSGIKFINANEFFSTDTGDVINVARWAKKSQIVDHSGTRGL